MSVAQFVQAACVLSSPASDAALRHSADQWLTAFKKSVEAWAVAQQVLAAQAPGLESALPAAQILAWKAKKQLGQLSLEQQSQLVEVLVGLLSTPAQGNVAALRRALCVALANLAIQCTDWSRPLETLGPRLPRATMVEFLTVLPQECEDAAVAVQSGVAEQAFQLKQRVREWCLDVMGWLHGVHCSGVQEPSTTVQQSASEAKMRLDHAQECALPLVRCFGAWAKWGCLEYIEPEHADYFTHVAGTLLLSGREAHVAIGVDAVSEVIEHASEALAPLLVNLVLQLPAQVEQAVRKGEGGGELSHVFSLFCGTHQRVCVGSTQDGAALRQGLLRLLALPRPQSPEVDEAAYEAWVEALLPAVDAAYEVVEHMLRLSRDGDDDGEQQAQEGTGTLAPRPITAGDRLDFCCTVLGTLLQQLQPFQAAFSQLGPGQAAQAWGGGSYPPQGLPQAVRDEAEVVVDVIAEVLGGDLLMQRLQAAIEAAVAQHSVRSMQTALALDVAFYCLRCGAGVYGSHHHQAGQALPVWFTGVLRVYSLAGEVWPLPQAGPQAPVTALDYDLLSSVTVLAPVLLPLLGAAQDASLPAGFVDLVLSRSLHAVSSPLRTPDVSHGSTTDAVDAAVDAVRAVCSFAASAGFQTTESMLGTIEQLLQLLQQPSRIHQYQIAHQQAVVALVHAAEGVHLSNTHLLQRAAASMQQYVFAPLTAALQQLQQELEHTSAHSEHPASTAGAAGSHSRHQRQPASSTTLWQLQWALKQVQALLNALELYQVYDDHAAHSGAPQLAPVAGMLTSAVEAFLGCWQPLVVVCRRQLPSETYQEVSLCLTSCISLDPRAFEPALGSLADLAAACFFSPGGSQLGQALCRAVEAYGSQPQYQQPLLGMLSCLLSTPQAQAMAGMRGGDANPEAAQALLSLVGCTLRQAASWQCSQTYPHDGACDSPASADAAALEALLSLALRLAVANAACNHKEVSQRAVASLSSLAVLALEWGSALGSAAREFVRRQGSGVVQGTLMALLSLNSGAHLPKVVSLVGDVALLAAACALTSLPPQHGAAAPQDPATVHAMTSQLLASWLADAQAGVAAAGILPQATAAALLGRLDWDGLLRQATVQVLQRQQEGGGSSWGSSGRVRGGLGSPGGVEVRRAMQRSLRQMADSIRQAGLCT